MVMLHAVNLGLEPNLHPLGAESKGQSGYFQNGKDHRARVIA